MTIMKKLVLLSITIILILGCGCKEKQSGFKITGEITQDSLKIEKVIFLHELNQIPDTIVLVSNRFVIKGNVSEPTNAVILINNKVIQFPLVNDEIEIKIKDVRKPDFTIHYLNSKVSENIEAYFKTESGDYVKVFKVINSKVAESTNDRDKIIFQSQADSLSLNFLNSIIDKYKSKKDIDGLSIIISDLTGLIGTKNHPEKIEELFLLLPDTLKNGFYGKKVKRYLDQSSQISLGQKIEFKFTDIKGQEYSLKDYQGKLVLLEFWASWCGPCISQIPSLTEVSEKSNKIQIVSISIDDDLNKWKEKVKQLKIGWINIHYLQKDYNLKEMFFINGVPYNILLSEKGDILRKNISMSDLLRLLD
jgi:thiol-disulfide isomerase/thioredoxin